MFIFQQEDKDDVDVACSLTQFTSHQKEEEEEEEVERIRDALLSRLRKVCKVFREFLSSGSPPSDFIMRSHHPNMIWSYSYVYCGLLLCCLCLITSDHRVESASSLPVPRKPKAVKVQRFYDSVNANILSAAMLSSAGAFNRHSSISRPIRQFRPSRKFPALFSNFDRNGQRSSSLPLIPVHSPIL